jgi:hypothetical protein
MLSDFERGLLNLPPNDLAALAQVYDYDDDPATLAVVGVFVPVEEVAK